jgi:hypothetical protein
MESATVPWNWLDPRDLSRWEAPPAAEPPAQGCIDADQLARLLQEPANDQVRYAIIRGWHPLVVAALISDAVLAGKTWIWLGNAGELRLVARDLRLAETAAPTVLAKLVDEPSDLVSVVASFPVPCPVIDLTGSAEALEDLRLKQRQAFMREHMTARRALVDLGHLLARRAQPRPYVPLASLAGRHAGRTAVCIAAGPSQDAALDLIRAFLPDCIVICVDIVHRTLVAAGIRVDYVVNLDSGEAVARRIGGSPDPRTVLVMPISGHRSMEAGFQRVSYLVSRQQPFEGGSAADHFWHGTNVGCGTIGLAVHLGCTEILLAGHDLSFSAGSYYAGSVADKDALQSFSLRNNAARQLEVPCNAGGMVRSNAQFAAGIDDIGYLLGRNPQVRAWNLAANQAVGAAIPGATALPADWRPQPAGTAAAPALPTDIFAVLASQQVLAECRSVAAAWSEQRQRGLPIRDARIAVGAQPGLGEACLLLEPFISGYLADALRLMALPATADAGPVIAEVERCCDATVQLWLERIERGITTDDWRAVPKRVWPEPEQRTWFKSLILWRIAQNPASSRGQYLSFCAREYAELQRAIPQAPLPVWRDLPDWVVLMAQLWLTAPDPVIAAFLDLCGLQDEDAVRTAAAQARSLGIAPLPVSPAAAACQRLRQQISEDLLADAELAASWLPAVPLVVDALLAKGSGAAQRLAVLEQIIRAGRIPVNDVLIGKVVATHPDIGAACALFEGHEKVMGEATTLAMAQRQASIGDVDGAIANLVRIRALSAYAADAWRLLCRLLTERLGAERMLAEMQGMWPQGQAALAIFAALGEKQGASAALLVVEGWRSGALPVEVLATMAQTVIAEQERLPAAAAASIGRLLDETAVQPGADAGRIAAIRGLLGRAAG